MNKSTGGRGREFPDTEPHTLPLALPEADSGYAQTEPQPLANVRPLPVNSLSLAPLEVTPYDLVQESRRDGRVCPLPTRWLEFYRLLEQLSGPAKLPAPPLVGSAWAATPNSAKRMCFREQVEWAVANNCVHAAHGFLKNLHEADWHYGA